MQVNPDAQRKAQAEIDAVVGNDRLPELKDRVNLPYTEALFKEVLRWQPVVRLAVPHVVSQDDVQDGYLIPKGTIIIASTWSVRLLFRYFLLSIWRYLTLSPSCWTTGR